MKKKIDKIGFCIHFAELINHYAAIWKSLDIDTFSILIACPTKLENDYIINYANEHGYKYLLTDKALKQKLEFKVLVSNQPFAAGHVRGQANVWLLGHIQVRMMYALGKAKWNFSPWNQKYNTILCWGKYHQDMLQNFPGVELVQVGYPRFDDYYNNPTDKALVAKNLELDPDKKTVLWLPTWHKMSSIDQYGDAISKLEKNFNLVVKVHPNTYTEEPERMAVLKRFGIKNVDDPFINNIGLISIADWVLADYGGSAFAAIYADTNVLLLNLSNPAEDELMGEHSLDLQLRQWLPSIDVNHATNIKNILNDDELWSQKTEIYQQLRDYLFFPTSGNAGALAAAELKRLLL